jgi:prepilin-type N-terminal cleavage/methylation domain-containing protein
MSRRRGFTLIELTVVLSVVVVLAGLLIVKVAGWTPRQSLNQSARGFGSALGLWRERARFDEASCRVVWRERSWSISTPEGQVLARGTLASDQRFDAEGSLVFDRRGSAIPMRVALTNTSGNRVTVVVDALRSGVGYESAR